MSARYVFLGLVALVALCLLIGLYPLSQGSASGRRLDRLQQRADHVANLREVQESAGAAAEQASGLAEAALALHAKAEPGAHDPFIVVLSKEELESRQEGAGADQSEDGDFGQDPFEARKEEEWPAFVIAGIMTAGEDPMALIKHTVEDNESLGFYRVGDAIEGFRVMEIESAHVVIASPMK